MKYCYEQETGDILNFVSDTTNVAGLAEGVLVGFSAALGEWGPEAVPGGQGFPTNVSEIEDHAQVMNRAQKLQALHAQCDNVASWEQLRDALKTYLEIEIASAVASNT